MLSCPFQCHARPTPKPLASLVQLCSRTNVCTYRTSTLHLDGAQDHVIDALFDLRALLGAVEQDRFVEVAIADMAQHAAEETEVLQVDLGGF